MDEDGDLPATLFMDHSPSTILHLISRQTREALCVARDCGILWPAAQVPLQLKNPFVVCAARNPWRQIVRKDAYTSLGNGRQRRRFQYGLQAIWRKQSHLPSVQGFLSPLSGEAIFRCSQIARLDSGLEYFAGPVPHKD